MSFILDPAGTFRHPARAIGRWALLAVLACAQGAALWAADASGQAVGEWDLNDPEPDNES